MSFREAVNEPAPRTFVSSAPIDSNFNEFVFQAVTEALDVLYLDSEDNKNILYRFTVNAEFGVDDNDHRITIFAWES